MKSFRFALCFLLAHLINKYLFQSGHPTLNIIGWVVFGFSLAFVVYKVAREFLARP